MTDKLIERLINKSRMECLNCEYKNAKFELGQLKAENETYKKMLEDEDVQLALTEIRSGERHLWFNKADKYKQALTEIKKIAEDESYVGFWDEQISQILKKCEVIDE